MQALVKRLQNSLAREDMRSNPVSAVAKRIWWKLRWLITKRDWTFILDTGQRLIAPHTGAAALIYYLGTSEPETTALLHRRLQPGMVFLDIGAHVGEYTLRASRIVGESGHVYAFEPDPTIISYLRKNADSHAPDNITVEQVAVADTAGEMQFAVQGEPSTSSLVPSDGKLTHTPKRTISVPVQTIDGYVAEQGIQQVDFIKIDIEGAELLAFRGAENLLSLPPGQAPTIYFEFSERLIQPFGYTGADVLEYLVERGYTIFNCRAHGDLSAVDLTVGQIPSTPNLLAVKQP